ncbi:MAG: hypothetical protein EHM59_07145 [Betaproteobacteria bacterium]|nr:MAG: hypothetical protein EHM59_07145 [Betaproteobacteria bacterium]
MWNVNVVRIYTGADNRSYFEELRLPMNEIVQGDRVSERSAPIPTSNMLFRENPLGRSEEYHTPKQRQFVITIAGAVEITCAGGRRVFGPGDVLFAEDVTGEGHSNRELHGPRRSLIIQVPPDFDIRRYTEPRGKS